MTALVIGIGGKLRAGKDAVADRLVAEHGFIKLGMSDPLLEHALILDPYIPVNSSHAFGLDGVERGDFVRLSFLVEQFGYVEAKKNPEVRRFLQADGTEGGRLFHDENVWVNRLARVIDEHLYADQRVVVTGIRFPNEVRMIGQFAGRTMWVERPDVDSATPAAGHSSENSITAQDLDRTILNDGSLQDLHATVDALMEGAHR